MLRKIGCAKYSDLYFIAGTDQECRRADLRRSFVLWRTTWRCYRPRVFLGRVCLAGHFPCLSAVLCGDQLETTQKSKDSKQPERVGAQTRNATHDLENCKPSRRSDTTRSEQPRPTTE